MGRTTAEIRQERLDKDPAFRERWERTAVARAVANAVIRYPANQGWTQTRLAKELGLQQPQVARLESGEHNPTFETLQRVSRMLGLRFIVDVIPPSFSFEQVESPVGIVLDEETTSSGRVVVTTFGLYQKVG